MSRTLTLFAQVPFCLKTFSNTVFFRSPFTSTRNPAAEDNDDYDEGGGDDDWLDEELDLYIFAEDQETSGVLISLCNLLLLNDEAIHDRVDFWNAWHEEQMLEMDSILAYARSPDRPRKKPQHASYPPPDDVYDLPDQVDLDALFKQARAKQLQIRQEELQEQRRMEEKLQREQEQRRRQEQNVALLHEKQAQFAVARRARQERSRAQAQYDHNKNESRLHTLSPAATATTLGMTASSCASSVSSMSTMSTISMESPAIQQSSPRLERAPPRSPAGTPRHRNTTTVASSSYEYTTPRPPRPTLGAAMQQRLQQRQQQEQQPHIKNALELTPGHWVALRGAEETWHALQQGTVCSVNCRVCTTPLLCVESAQYVLCPVCKIVSPLDAESNCSGLSTMLEETPRHGVGLGVRAEDVA